MNLDERTPAVRGNAQRIEQVVINLLQNSCQSLKDRKRAISISTSHDPDAGTVILRIKDEGEGIDEQSLEKIIEPFFTTKWSEGGTGLGLYISRAIVEDHKGSLTFASTKGEGTTATVILPLGH